MNTTHVFERTEMKYRMNREAYHQILRTVQKYMNLDEFGHSLICNLYYDTPDYLLIRKSLEHPLYKEKLRVRSYGVSSPEDKVYMELKKKYDDIVYKRRTSLKEKMIRSYFRERNGGQIDREIRYTFDKYQNLKPRVYLSYEREAYYMKEGDPDFRVTFDENILFRTTELSLKIPPFGTPVIEKDQVLMELKCADSIPFWMARALSEAGVFKCSFSKYGSAYTKIMNEGEMKYAAVI